MRGRWLVGTAVIAAAILAIVLLRCDREPATTGGANVASGSTRALTATTASARRDAKVLPKPPAGGLRLEGQVIDENDQPVGGATVRFYNFDPETVTAEDGSFVFEHLAAHDNYQVTASKGEDTWCEMVRVTLSETSEPVILRLHPGAIATVHVVDATDGKPIAGARLGTRVTDANGDVRVRGLQPGGSHIYIVRVEADGFEEGRAKITDLDLANPGDNVFRVELKRGRPVRGTVVGPSGEPLADAWVTGSGPSRGEAQTDARGAWTLTLSAGKHELEASAKGFLDAKLVVESDGVQAVDGIAFKLQRAPIETQQTVLAGIVLDEAGKAIGGAEIGVETDLGRWKEASDAQGRFRVDIGAEARWATLTARKGELASPATTVSAGTREETQLVIGRTSIAGIVVDSRGRPAPGVRVFLRTVMIDANAVSDAKGHFELTGLPPGDHALLVAHTEQEYSKIDQGVVASTGARDVRLVVTDLGNVSGRVVLDGKPVAYFGVYVPDADQVLDHPLIVRAQDGRFTIRGLVAGTWTLLLAGPSFGRKSLANVVVREGGDVELGDIAVDRGRTVRGRVADISGAAVGGATVTVHERESPRNALARAVEGTGIATTDATGAYRITGLAPSLWTTQRRIVATHPTRGVSVERLLTDDAIEVNLVVHKAGGIDGRLEGVETGVFCQRVDDPSFTYAESPDKSGRFRFDDLPPGAYRLRPNAVSAAVALVTVVGGQRAKATLVVPPERIEVRITGSCSKAIALWTDDALDELDDQSCGSTFTVRPGAYRACVDGDKKCTPIKVLPSPAKQTFAR